MEQSNEGQPIKLYSRTVSNILFDLDGQCESMEKYIRKLEKENEELNKQISKRVFEDMDAGQKMIGETLKAILSVPDDMSSLGTVGATVVRKIYDMKTIEQVKSYCEELFSKGRKQLKDKEKAK